MSGEFALELEQLVVRPFYCQIQSNMNQAIQIQGKHIDAARLRGLFFSLANQLKHQANITGSIDSDDYGTQCSFVLGDTILGISVNTMKKGGML